MQAWAPPSGTCTLIQSKNALKPPPSLSNTLQRYLPCAVINATSNFFLLTSTPMDDGIAFSQQRAAFDMRTLICGVATSARLHRRRPKTPFELQRRIRQVPLSATHAPSTWIHARSSWRAPFSAIGASPLSYQDPRVGMTLSQGWILRLRAG